MRDINGRMPQGEHPTWEPLLDWLGDELTGWFMWMFEVELEDGRSLHAYKHMETRRYLHLSLTGEVFVFTEEGRYRSVHRSIVWRVLPYDQWPLVPEADEESGCERIK